MKTISDFINESSVNRAKTGSILEVELIRDGHFYWADEKDYPNMNDWEIRPSENGHGFVIKIGKLDDLK